MKNGTLLYGLVLLITIGTELSAQEPHIIGTWKLNAEASVYPGPLPQSQVRAYFPTDDGFVVGIAVTIDAQGNPSFLQYTAKTDGRDYPEYDVGSLARLQAFGTPTNATYAETQIDEYTVEIVDKRNGVAYITGTRSVSPDGQTMTIVAEASVPDGRSSTFTLVYDRQ